MKFKELNKLSDKELKKKFKELKMELAKANASKTETKRKQIKKIIAKIETINNSKKGKVEKGGNN